jgi:hypothetical protein
MSLGFFEVESFRIVALHCCLIQSTAAEQFYFPSFSNASLNRSTMKTSSVLSVICFSLLALQLGGCKDDRKHHDGPIESHSGGTSDITGFIKLIDETGTVQTDNSGILVSADGTSHVSATDVNGKWTLAAMQTGTYSFTFSKSGYGTIKGSFEIVGGGSPTIYYGTQELLKVPTYTVANLAATVTSSLVTLNGTFSSALPSARNARIFIGKTASVTANNPSSYSYTAVPTVSSDGSGFSFSPYNLAAYGIPSGTTVYAVAYGANTSFYFNGGTYYSLSEGYTDPTTGNFVYTNLSSTPSNVVSFVTP